MQIMSYWCPRHDHWTDLARCEARAQRRCCGCVTCKTLKEQRRSQPPKDIITKQNYGEKMFFPLDN